MEPTTDPTPTAEFHAKACRTGGYVVTWFHPEHGMTETAVESTSGIRNLAKEFCDACSVVVTN